MTIYTKKNLTIKLMTLEPEIGIDIIEVERFREKPFFENKFFYKKIFTDNEIEYCNTFSNPYVHFAGIFAAKESVIKSLLKPIDMKSIEIIRTTSGKPNVSFHGKFSKSVKVSISHSTNFAIALAVNLGMNLED